MLLYRVQLPIFQTAENENYSFMLSIYPLHRSLLLIQSLERKKGLLIVLISDWPILISDRPIQFCLTFSEITITNLQNNHCEWIASHKYRFLRILTGNAHTYPPMTNKQHTTHTMCSMFIHPPTTRYQHISTTENIKKTSSY